MGPIICSSAKSKGKLQPGFIRERKMVDRSLKQRALEIAGRNFRLKVAEDAFYLPDEIKVEFVCIASFVTPMEISG